MRLWWRRHRKAVVAALGGLALLVLQRTLHLDSEAVQAVSALLLAAGVFAVPNERKNDG